MKEDDKLFHALVLSVTLSKYVLNQVYDVLGHNGTASVMYSSAICE